MRAALVFRSRPLLALGSRRPRLFSIVSRMTRTRAANVNWAIRRKKTTTTLRREIMRRLAMSESKADEKGGAKGRSKRQGETYVRPWISSAHLYIYLHKLFSVRNFCTLNNEQASCQGRQKTPKHAAHSDVDRRRQIIFLFLKTSSKYLPLQWKSL